MKAINTAPEDGVILVVCEKLLCNMQSVFHQLTDL